MVARSAGSVTVPGIWAGGARTQGGAAGALRLVREARAAGGQVRRGSSGEKQRVGEQVQAWDW